MAQTNPARAPLSTADFPLPALTLIAPISWRVLAETTFGITVEVRFHRADDSVDVAVVHFDSVMSCSVVSKATPSSWDLRELRSDVARYSLGAAIYLEAL